MCSKLGQETGYYDMISMILKLTAKYIENCLKLGIDRFLPCPFPSLMTNHPIIR
jgi:hypothetical protein